MDFQQALENILYSHNDRALIEKAITVIYEVLSQETGIRAEPTKALLETRNGRVVSQSTAATCVNYARRTTQFLRGINRAIRDQLRTKRNVSILYAGCGPYATLITPLIAQFSSNEISITLLDINEDSLNAVQKLYRHWNLENYIKDYLCADATDPNIRFNGGFDLIISETMQLGLKNECQVPLTRNLIHFLNPGGVFVPQNIKLDIFLTEMMMPSANDDEERLFLGTAYELHYKNIPPPNYQTVISVPETRLEYLRLFTGLQIYEDVRLDWRDHSTLTMPLILNRFKNRWPKAIKFIYVEGTTPELAFDCVFDRLP